MSSFRTPIKLIRCELDSAGDPATELIVVEGDSASRAVERVRDARFQAVLPMQGKPLSADRASDRAVRNHPWFAALMDALGADWDGGIGGGLRYGRLLLLMDPDADGIHCGVLLMLFIDRYLRPMIDARQVSLIKPPMFEIRADGYRERLYAYTEDHLGRYRAILGDKGIGIKVQRYRGLAGMDSETLRTTCVDPGSRTAYLVRHEDIAQSRRLFGSA